MQSKRCVACGEVFEPRPPVPPGSATAVKPRVSASGAGVGSRRSAEAMPTIAITRDGHNRPGSSTIASTGASIDAPTRNTPVVAKLGGRLQVNVHSHWTMVRAALTRPVKTCADLWLQYRVDENIV